MFSILARPHAGSPEVDYQQLIPGRLIKRYKRFLADVELQNGETITAHCPNTGSMRNCCNPGSRVWLYDSNNPKRKLRYTWELVEVANRYLACINTQRANHLVREAVEKDLIPELKGYETLIPEQRFGVENSRVDLLLKNDGVPDCYVEIKNVTLLQEGDQGIFPDAVTERGRKHLRELMEVVNNGNRAVLFFNVAHTGIHRIAPAWDIDLKYSMALEDAIEAGVEVLAYGANISPEAIQLEKRINFCMR